MAEEYCVEDIYEYMTLEEFKELLSNEGKVISEIQVEFNHGLKGCYLGTHHMDMRFLSPHETVTYGNHSLEWVIRSAEKPEGAHLISNVVTDEANEKPRIGRTKTYLKLRNRVKDNEYNVELKGPGSPFYFREDTGKSSRLYAIYTVLDDHGTEAYLQPASHKEHKLTAIVGPPKFIFKLPRVKKSIQLPAAANKLQHTIM